GSTAFADDFHAFDPRERLGFKTMPSARARTHPRSRASITACIENDQDCVIRAVDPRPQPPLGGIEPERQPGTSVAPSLPQKRTCAGKRSPQTGQTFVRALAARKSA